MAGIQEVHELVAKGKAKQIAAAVQEARMSVPPRKY